MSEVQARPKGSGRGPDESQGKVARQRTQPAQGGRMSAAEDKFALS